MGQLPVPSPDIGVEAMNDMSYSMLEAVDKSPRESDLYWESAEAIASNTAAQMASPDFFPD